MWKLRVAFAGPVVASLLLTACRHRPPPVEPPPPGPPAPGVVLPPPGSEPRYSIATDDPDEIALLVERFKLQKATVRGGTLYFASDESQLRQIRELGYAVDRVDPEMVDIRVLRVARRGTEDSLRASGVVVVTREPAYWIVSGTLAQLRRLVAAGYRLDSLRTGEPRPRWIRLVVPTGADVQRVANFGVDIFSVADTVGQFRILGAAQDMQLDRLREAGFTVVLLPTP